MKNYILVTYYLSDGFKRDFRVVEESNEKERLEYILNCQKYNDLKQKGYIFKIFVEENL